MDSTDNLELWNKVCETDPDHAKPVEFGRKFTALDAHYQVRAATEQFGPAGKGWGWDVVDIQYPPIEAVFIKIRLWHKNRENYIEQWGGSTLLFKGKPDTDAFKKATTDGLTKCLSYLGFNADVFLGKFDDNKYVAQMEEKYKEPKEGEVKSIFTPNMQFKTLTDKTTWKKNAVAKIEATESEEDLRNWQNENAAKIGGLLSDEQERLNTIIAGKMSGFMDKGFEQQTNGVKA